MQNMPYVLAALGTVLTFLLLLLELTGGTLRGLAGYFVEELDENHMPVAPVRLTLRRNVRKPETDDAPVKPARSEKTHRTSRRESDGSRTVLAILTHKIDERKRVVDSSGHSTLYDEYFELVFETREGETLRLTAPRAAFKETPFNQDGYLTYQDGRFLRFRYSRPKIAHMPIE